MAGASAKPTARPAGRRASADLVSETSQPYTMYTCNDYEQNARWAEYCKMMQDLKLGILT